MSTGHGLLWDNENERRHLAFRTKWLSYRQLKPEDLKVAFASGDSILVDISNTKITGGAICVLRMGEHLYAKRIESRIDGGVSIISDNPSYSPQTIQADELEQLQAIGKVIWVGKDVLL